MNYETIYEFNDDEQSIREVRLYPMPSLPIKDDTTKIFIVDKKEYFKRKLKGK